MVMAAQLSHLGTCSRRKVGAIFLDSRFRVLSTGYNGTPYGLIHCTGQCAGELSTTGKDLDKCEAVHAEQNALLQCSNVDNILYVMVTVSPCMHCTKLLLNTGCKHIYSYEIYDTAAAAYWRESGRTLTQVKLYD